MTYVLDTEQPGAGSGVPALLQVDPRVRIVAVTAFALVTVSLHSLAALLLALAVSVAAMIHARLASGATIRQMIGMDMFMIFLIVSLPFTTAGEPAFVIFGLAASWQGIWDALRIGIIANAVVLMMLVALSPMGPVQLGHALARLKVPPMLVHLLLFTVRYIEVLHDEYKRLRVAMRARGFSAGTNMHTARTLGYLLGMLLIRAIDRSERILKAMKCRGFHGEFPMFDDMRLVADRDYGFAALATGIIVVLIALEVFHVLPV